MRISSIYNKLALISPRLEVALRRIYWKNVRILGRYNPHKVGRAPESSKHVDFSSIISWLNDNGVGRGSLLIVHSSYSALECTGLDANQIIDALLELVGPTGTLAMPAIRRYKEAEKAVASGLDLESVTCKYDVKKTLVQSGMLPYMMLRRKDSVVSHHPLNPLVAIGPLASPMMEHNLEGDRPTPHGPNSSWKFCYDHNAFVAWLGVDSDHYNTISHINEEAFGNWKWTEEEWYRDRTFIIVDEEGNEQETVVRERKPEWGMMHFAELHANKDRNSSGLIKKTMIENEVSVCVERAKDYVDYLQSNNKKGKYYYL